MGIEYAALWWHWPPRINILQTPPGPEGSNGSESIECAGMANAATCDSSAHWMCLVTYQVLARKWRPQNFAQIIGQTHVVQALTNALKNNRVHHAYLFSGTRGVGKTTLARIIAKCLNCDSGITATPCEQCTTCKAINQGRMVDVLEVDAASRTKVEDTRELLDNVQYAPTQARYKIYIIDEVHMLSGHSFNALLKTLEEPPPHVKFLLATTDPQKLPITVLSRCLQFHLKPISTQLIQQQLNHILSQENVAYESQGLAQISQAARGSMRDALSLLDQAIAFSDQQVTEENVRHMLGNIPQQDITALLQAVITREGNLLWQNLTQLHEAGIDCQVVLSELLHLLHDITLLQTIPESITQHPQQAQLQHLANSASAEDLQLYYQIALHGQRDMPLANTPQQGLNMTLLRMLAFTPYSTEPSAQQFSKPQQSTTPITNPTDNSSLENLSWADLLAKLQLTGPYYALASHCVLQSYNGHAMQLILAPKFRALLTPMRQQQLQQALEQHLGHALKLSIDIEQTEQTCPAAQQQQQQTAQQQQVLQSLEDNPNVQNILSEFDAKILPETIKVAAETVE
jgi:DNA polymerase-3 subunit gamma/tau